MKQDHEKLISGKDPKPMISIPPRCYVVIANPVILSSDGSVSMDKHGQANIRHGDLEIRFHENYSDPFPLYPREEVQGDVQKLRVVSADSALLIQAEREHIDEDGNKRVPGDLWYFSGPGTYIPRIEQIVAKEVQFRKIKINQALKLRAERLVKNGLSVIQVHICLEFMKRL
jgi:major vault protein